MRVEEHYKHANNQRSLKSEGHPELEWRWIAENKGVIDAYNEHIDRDGIFGSRTRRF